jgi:FkbM family methyltransferase
MIDEHWLVEFIERAAIADELAFDIGANVGEWARALSPKFGGVLSVEADPRAYGELVRNAPGNVLAHHAAATAACGAVQFHLRPSHLQSSLLEKHPIGAGDQAEAPIIETVGVNGLTLDFLLFVARQRFGDIPLGFVKVDVEGAEGDVLAGATDPLFGRVKWLIEVHDREQAVGLQLHRLGYESIDIIPHPSDFAHPKHFWVYAEPARSE